MVKIIKKGDTFEMRNYIGGTMIKVVAVCDEYVNDDDIDEVHVIIVETEDEAMAIWIEEEEIWELMEGSWYQ